MLDLRFTMQLSLQLRSLVMIPEIEQTAGASGLAAIGLAATGGLPSAADAAVSKVLRAPAVPTFGARSTGLDFTA